MLWKYHVWFKCATSIQLSELILHKSSGSICEICVCDCFWYVIVSVWRASHSIPFTLTLLNGIRYFSLFRGEEPIAMFMHIRGHKINVLVCLCNFSDVPLNDHKIHACIRQRWVNIAMPKKTNEANKWRSNNNYNSERERIKKMMEKKGFYFYS